MSTLVMAALANEIREYEKKLAKEDRSETERLWAEYKIAEMRYRLWLHVRGYEELTKHRRLKAEADRGRS